MARPQIQLSQGTVIGTTLLEHYPYAIEAFRGVPYALPPTGDRRFRPPVKVEPSQKTIDASKFGPRAPAQQFVKVGPVLDESEDCLTVNVFRQARHNISATLPVAVYFHGGAFNRGNAAMHDTASMVGWSELPFIGVSFGYRIGAFGFLPSSLSAKEGALNLGLKDQICLLEWIQENIHRFGGDKNNVTLIGLSAGAHSFKDLLREVECPQSLPESEIFRYLRSLPATTIAKAQNTVFYRYNPSLRWAFQPVIDNEIIRTRPIDAWRSGRWHKVPIMTGFQGNEGSIYVNKKMSSSLEFLEFWRTLLPQLSDDDIQAIDQLYPDPNKVPDSLYKETRSEVGPQFKRIEAAYAQYAYVAPVRQTAFFASKNVPVYLYHFAQRLDPIDGARHGVNMLYEVRDRAVCAKTESQNELSGNLHAYVTSFICTGTPNAPGGPYSDRPEWKIYSRDDAKVMIFGKDNTEFIGGQDKGELALLVDDVYARKESEFWWSKVELSQQ